MGVWEEWEALPWEPESSPPKLAVVVDGHPVYEGLVLPKEEELARHASRWGGSPDHQSWWNELRGRLQERYPAAREVQVYGVWAGNPPTRVSLSPKGRKEVGEAWKLLEEFPEEPPF